MKKIMLLTAFLCNSLLVTGQDGTLDATFGNGGWATAQTLSTYCEATCMAVQSDGKILFAGTVAFGGSTIVVGRFNTNGSLDNTFGNNGFFTTNLGASNLISCMAIDGNGKIVLGGDYNNKPMLMRINPNGTIDNTFDTDGYVEFDGGLSRVVDIRILAGNKILGCANALINNQSVAALFRRNADGSADDSFGTNGIKTADLGDQEAIFRFTVAADGKIYVVGTAFKNTTKYDLLVARFNANGNLDNTFGNNGIVLQAYGTTGNPNEQGNDVAIQSDGKVVVAGRNNVGLTTTFLVARFNANGTVDNTFGTNGRVFTAISTSNDEARCIALLSNGGILLGGFATISNNRNLAMVKYTANGTLDNTFGSGGIVTEKHSLKASCEEFRVLPNGKIVAAGYVEPANLNRSFAVVRINHSTTSGVAVLSAEQLGVKIFPNPGVRGSAIQLRFELTEKSVVAAHLVAADGRMLHPFFQQHFPASEHQLPLLLPQNLTPGVYFIQMFTEKGVLSLPLEVL